MNKTNGVIGWEKAGDTHHHEAVVSRGVLYVKW